MKKLSILFLAVFSIFVAVFTNLSESVYAISLDIEEIDMGSTIIAELNNPAKFTLKIKNNNLTDDFEIFSLVGVSMSPKGTFRIDSGQTKEIEVQAWPSREIRDNNRGFFIFEYQIAGSSSIGVVKDRLRINIVELKDVLEISPVNIGPLDNKAEITITNKENTNIEGAEISFRSLFFEFSENIFLSPGESMTLAVPLKKENLLGLEAGQYDLLAEIGFQDALAEATGKISYLEREGISSSRSIDGIIIIRETLQKTNLGNVNSAARITDRKDILSRLFTIYSPVPDSVERKGLFVEYFWEENLAPAESLTVTSRTDYTFPFMILIAIVLITLIVKIYLQTNLTLTKNVSFVKTKGGEFALKTTIRARARKGVDNVRIMERIPRIMKLYDKFGARPDKIDHSTRTLNWEIKRLNVGEEKTFSYIMYSKINLVGKVELPQTSGFYEKDGKKVRVLSNKSFVAAETATAKD